MIGGFHSLGPLFVLAASMAGGHLGIGLHAQTAIDLKYKALGGPRAFLGSAVTGEFPTPDGIGRFRRFQGGSIYWSRSTGAHEVHGLILKKWEELEWERGALGYPVTDETAAPDSNRRFTEFEHGSIYWTPATGAHAVYGAIHEKWVESGKEKGPLGYPITDEEPTPDGTGRVSKFEHGSIVWSFGRDARVILNQTSQSATPSNPASATPGSPADSAPTGLAGLAVIVGIVALVGFTVWCVRRQGQRIMARPAGPSAQPSGAGSRELPVKSHDVFISYSSKDKVVADAACARLEGAGIRCWIAPRDVVPGMGWAGAIVDGIRASRVMILVFSAEANRSTQILREVERAVNAGVVVVPFRLEDVAPSGDLEYFISAHHWLDAMTPPLEAHLERLIGTIRQLLTRPVQPPRASDVAAGPAASES